MQAEAKARALEEALGDELGKKEEDDARRRLREEHIERRRAELLAANLPPKELASRLDQLAAEAARMFDFDVERAEKARREQKEAEDAALRALQEAADRAEEAARRAERAYAQLILERAEKERLRTAERNAAGPAGRRRAAARRGTDETGAGTIDEEGSVAGSESPRKKKVVIKKVVKKVAKAAEEAVEEVAERAEAKLRVKTKKAAGEGADEAESAGAVTPADSLAAQTPFSVEAHVHDRMVHVAFAGGQGPAAAPAKPPDGIHSVFTVVMARHTAPPPVSPTLAPSRSPSPPQRRDGPCHSHPALLPGSSPRWRRTWRAPLATPRWRPCGTPATARASASSAATPTASGPPAASATSCAGPLPRRSPPSPPSLMPLPRCVRFLRACEHSRPHAPPAAARSPPVPGTRPCASGTARASASTP